MTVVERVRILLLDDHTLFREGLARLLTAESDLELVAHCGSVDEALAVLAAGPIDLVLLDVDLGEERGETFLRRARQAGYSARVLVVTGGLTNAQAVQLIEDGASGVFFKDNPTADLTTGIRTVMHGGAWIDADLLAALVAARQSASQTDSAGGLNSRELEVLRGVFEGLANKEIGARLGISESSVKATLQQLFLKTGVRTRSQLVRIALERYRDAL